MRITMSTSYVTYVTVLLAYVSGCILPIPHKRVSRVGCEGTVRDANTGNPIKGAIVHVIYSGQTNITSRTDSRGHYKVEDKLTWHYALFIGIPTSFSLFPTLDAPRTPSAISVTADGYAPWIWKSWVDIDDIVSPYDDLAENDSSNVELKAIKQKRESQVEINGKQNSL